MIDDTYILISNIMFGLSFLAEGIGRFFLIGIGFLWLAAAIWMGAVEKI
jgi:hypothetical protein